MIGVDYPDDRLVDWAEEDRERHPLSPECDEERAGEDEHERCSWQICYCGCHYDEDGAP